MHEKVCQILGGYSKVFFDPLYGNNGDQLIEKGTLALFEDIGLRLVESPALSDVIVVNGGAQMTSVWGGLALLDKYITSYDKPIVVMPCSFLGDEELRSLSDLVTKYARNVHLFCREQASYERLCSAFADKSKIYLSHDMAFYLSRDYLNNQFRVKKGRACGALVVERKDAERSTDIQGEKSWKIPLKSYLPQWLKRPIKSALVIRQGSNTAFMDSCKAVLRDQYPDILNEKTIYLDISDPSICSMRNFLRLINDAEIVFTTRLHVAITCELYQTRCYLKPTGGQFQKNEMVYANSLSQSKYVDLMN